MDIPYTVKPRPDTGLYNAKIALWLFLASEVMLFGGLFSGYIFLRIASETPWPTHVLNVKAGFVNTLILIFSSITVLQAWLSLKMRNFGRFRLYMVLTLICSVVFMTIKMFEYNDKFHHYGVVLQDGSVIEGHLKDGAYDVKFGEVTGITLASHADSMGLFDITLGSMGSDGKFLNYLADGAGKVQVKDNTGATQTLDADKVAEVMSGKRKEAKRVRSENKVKKKLGETLLPTPAPNLSYTTVAPVEFKIPAGKIKSYTNTQVILRDGTILDGKVLDDTLRLEADKVDLRRLITDTTRDPEVAYELAANSTALKLLGEHTKSDFLKHKEEVLKEHPKPKLRDKDFSREAFTMSLGAHGEHGGEGAPEHPVVEIPRKEISLYSNFTPKYHNYFAIYFALTSLHGLHIIGGALVLGHFLFFGKRIYDKDPEHLANRVEVGGLFWHFVDVVWMILFPVLYLM